MMKIPSFKVLFTTILMILSVVSYVGAVML